MKKGLSPASDACAGGTASEGHRIEWPTIGLVLFTHGGWAAILAGAGWLGPLPSLLLLVPLLALHSSLQHEVLHGHPFRSARLNEGCVFLPLGLWLPYRRFRDTHLAHHRDPALTDPYDDPESNFVHPADWAGLPAPWKVVLRMQNTLLGRMAFGPAVSAFRLWRDDLRAMAREDGAVFLAWALHLPGLALVLWAVSLSALPLWAYGAAAYGSVSVLKIRTFLEHRAHHLPRARSVVIEDRGLLAFLFLNNNLHALHHARPRLPWYALPAAYDAEREATLVRNGGYRYRSYAEVIGTHLLRAKDPVTHPLREGFVPDADPSPGTLAAWDRTGAA
ncbi:fatty acid desaturase [Hasllibacter halocynthiae]|uniref:Fatty acid desaturase n=1 Tax=Hasllibacter halocynthiae TaxID=595589 RepID=A0A2T0X6P0_9RHOB|nr:fatty acid desaturase [Hasllibacter halocynthiae]PRY94620.1 fatty acid desaturase [Hasllibacter halocynthiae]